MTTKLDRAGRVKDILEFLHWSYLQLGEGSTIGEYARSRGMAKSPYLRQLFKQLEFEQIIVGKDENYRATVMRTFKVDYQNVTKLYPHIRQILTEFGWQDELL